MTVNQTELGKIKQVLNNKVDRDFYNINEDNFNRAVTQTQIMQSSLANFSGEDQSSIGAKTGWLHYDEDNDILSVKTASGDFREVGGIGDELRSLTSIIHTKELTHQDDGNELRVLLDERYPVSKEKGNVQLFINGILKSNELFTIDDNGLTIVVSPDAFVSGETAFVKIQYMNYVPSSATKAGITTLGSIGETYVDGWLETGAVYADGAEYKKNPDGTYSKIVEIEGIEYTYPTEDFSEELYSKLRFLDINEAGEHTELVNDGTKNYINAVSFENWEVNRQYFAFDPDNYRYRVPEVNSSLASTKKYVIVKSIYTEVLSIAKNILSTKSYIQNTVSDMTLLLNSAAGRILDISSTSSFIKLTDGIGLLGSTRIYFPISNVSDIQQFAEYILSPNMEAYLRLDLSELNNGEYFVILNKIGTGSVRYSPIYIPIDKFFYLNTPGGEQSGAYLYKDTFKIKVFSNSTEQPGDYSLPVGIIKIESGNVVATRGASNLFQVNNAVIIYPGIKFNFPLGFDEAFNRRNSVATNASPYILQLTYQNGSIYAELNDENVTVSISDKILEYNFDQNMSFLDGTRLQACRICIINEGNLIFPDYDRFFVQEKLLHEKANLYFENTGFLSNGAIELPEIQSTYSNSEFTLKKGARFLIADGIFDNHRLKSIDYTTVRDYSLTLDRSYEDAHIFYDYDNDSLFASEQYIKSDLLPEDLENGLVWYDTLNNVNKVYDGSTWITKHIVEVANYLNTNSSGVISRVQDIGIVKSGDGRNSGGEAKWGKIKGEISAQLDLQKEFDLITNYISIFTPVLDATQILNEFGLDLEDGALVYYTVDNKLYEYSKSDDQFSLSTVPLDNNRLYFNELAKEIYLYTNGEMVLYGTSKLGGVISIHEETISQGSQVIRFSYPCDSIILVSIGQVVLDPSDYIFTSGSDHITLAVPAEVDGYVRYTSIYRPSDISSNYMKYIRYEVTETTNYLEIPLSYRCTNVDSVIAVTVGTGVVPRDLISLTNNNNTLRIVSSDAWSAGEVIDVWYGVMLESGPTQPDNLTIQRNTVGDLEAIALKTSTSKLKVADPITLSDWKQLQNKDPETFYPIIDDMGDSAGSLNCFGFYKFSVFLLDTIYWAECGSTHSKIEFRDFYNWLYKIYSGSLSVTNISVKNINDSDIGKFDFVIDIANETFRLPQSVDDRILISKQRSTSSNNGWYNCYADGWCEQGGKLTAPAGMTEYSFLKEFIDTSYDFAVTPGFGSSVTPFAVGYSSTMSETEFSIKTDQQCAIYWKASGYTEIPDSADMTTGKIYFLVALASSIA